MPVIGWDIGGVNTKVARVDGGVLLGARSVPFEVQRAPEQLAPLLGEIATALAAEGDVHALTMTAELSQLFRTKREGVAFVLDAVRHAFPRASVYVYGTDGRFRSPDRARAEPIAVAASNWHASASLAAREHPDAILVDVGSTTTDVIPIADGAVVARGRTDPDRLAHGELLYLGALRTPVEAIVQEVPLRGEMAGVSAEGFALAGDVHLWRGDLDPAAYTAPTPDGRPATREYAGERLARVVCADREMLRDTDIDAIAAHVAAAQIARIGDAITRVRTRHSALATAIVTGSGDFLAHAAAERSGMQVSCIEVRASRLESRHEGVEGPSLESPISMHEFSAFAVALLLESERSAS